MAEIKRYVRPQRLYRYRSLKYIDREIDAIEKGYVYCSPYMNLNDPMEGLFSSSHRIKKHTKFRAALDEIRQNKTRLGICSFSEVHNHELMWAHYADQYRGICLAYSFPSLLEHLSEEVQFVRMYYSETVPTFGRIDQDKVHAAKMILSYKNYKWLYEREWRMFGPLGEAYYGRKLSLRRIYLGSRITDGHRDRLLRTIKPLKIKPLEMTIDKYSITFEPISGS